MALSQGDSMNQFEYTKHEDACISVQQTVSETCSLAELSGFPAMHLDFGS